jgi:bifunctional DNA-binding transcriptional regulator/antitoxin component of YhaV-PrlF toxin-antitoxin module
VCIDAASSAAVVMPRRPTTLRSRAARRTFTFVAKVRERRRGATTISSKNQITIPAAELRAAGLEAGERLVARADGPGRVVLEREHDVLADFVGALTGVYGPDEIDTLRREWE